MLKRIILLLNIALVSVLVYADTKLPNVCEAFLPSMLYNSQSIKSADVDELSGSENYFQNVQDNSANRQYWIVYSDRANNVTYTEPNKNSAAYSELDFAQVLRIAKIEDGYALVYVEPRMGTKYPIISSEAESKGWVPMENLLLWSVSLANQSGIYRKVIPALNVENVTATDYSDLIAEPLYLGPDESASRKKTRSGSEINYIVKEAENGMLLIATHYTLNGRESVNALKGWVKPTDVYLLENNSFLEPEWEIQVVEKHLAAGDAAGLFTDKELTNQADKMIPGNQVIQNQADKYRIKADEMRFPVLEENNVSYRMSHFTKVVKRVDATQIEGVVEAREAQKAAIESANNLNLIVVIDGTKGMDNYFKAARTAINTIGASLSGKRNLQVGLVIYRDIADGDDGQVEYLPMLDYNDELLRQYFLDGGEYGVTSVAADKSKEDALYLGLENALDSKAMFYNSASNNLFLVIGECGNVVTENDSIQQLELANRIIENNVDIAAFQVRKSKGDAWQLFEDQIRKISEQSVLARYAYNMSDTLGCMQDTVIGFDVIPADSANMYYMGSFRRLDNSDYLDTTIFKALVVERVMEYNKMIDNRALALSKPEIDQENQLRVDSLYAVSVLGRENYMLVDTKSYSLENTVYKTYYSPKQSQNGNNYWREVALLSQTELVSLTDRLSEIEGWFANREELSDKLKELVYPYLSQEDRKQINYINYQYALALIQGLDASKYLLSDSPRLWELSDSRFCSNDEYRRLESNFKAKLRNMRAIITTRTMPYVWHNNDIDYYWIPTDRFIQ